MVDKYSTKHTEQAVLNGAVDDNFDPSPLLVEDQEFDGTNLLKKVSKLTAKKITTSGNFTYVATAPIGTAQATAGWQVKRIEVSGNDTIITWADGDANFDNIATDLTGLTYA
jgi:hypothetical protein